MPAAEQQHDLSEDSDTVCGFCENDEPFFAAKIGQGQCRYCKDFFTGLSVIVNGKVVCFECMEEHFEPCATDYSNWHRL